jgi:hypothetical protein
MPWSELNEILKRHRLDQPRLRLMRDGRNMPASSYLKHATNRRKKFTIPRLLPAELTKQLREGATLVLDAVDELYSPVEELAAGLERAFREHVQVNLYAGWRTSKGFDLHWDDHDVFILQVAGRKRWAVYGETRKHPLSQDVEKNLRPEGEPLWDATLEDGDLLYIPRGWWHVAFPLDEPTLHLTVGVHRRTGIDLLRWLTERLRASELFRSDLPRLASEDGRRGHAERLRDELLASWDANLLEDYFADSDMKAEARPFFSLPWGATSEPLPEDGETLVRLTAPRPLDLNGGARNGTLEFSCLGKHWQFASDALAVIGPLSDGRALSVAELCEAASEKLDEQRVRAFLGELIQEGLLAVVRDGAGGG